MSRLFPALALAAAVMLAGSVLSGFWSADPSFRDRHVLLGVIAAVAACLVHCVALTYSIVSTKMIKQVVQLGDLDRAVLPVIWRMSWRMGWVIMASCVLLAVVAGTGGVAWRQEGLQLLHPMVGVAVLLENLYAFYLEYRFVLQKGGILHDTMTAYQLGEQDA